MQYSSTYSSCNNTHHQQASYHLCPLQNNTAKPQHHQQLCTSSFNTTPCTSLWSTYWMGPMKEHPMHQPNLKFTPTNSIPHASMTASTHHTHNVKPMTPNRISQLGPKHRPLHHQSPASKTQQTQQSSNHQIFLQQTTQHAMIQCHPFSHSKLPPLTQKSLYTLCTFNSVQEFLSHAQYPHSTWVDLVLPNLAPTITEWFLTVGSYGTHKTLTDTVPT